MPHGTTRGDVRIAPDSARLPLRDDLREVNDQLAHSPSEVSQYRDGWLFGYPEGRFIEKYLGGNVGIAFRRAEALGREPVKDGFVIYRHAVSVQMGVEHRDVSDVHRRLYHQQSFVLPQDVELMENVQERIASSVSPRVFDRGSFHGTDPLFRFHHRYDVKKLGDGSADGEVSLVFGFWCVARQHGVHEDVQGSANGIDDCADVAGDQWIKGFNLLDCQQFPFGVIRIGLHDRLVWATPLPGYESLLEHWDMGYGPVDGTIGLS